MATGFALGSTEFIVCCLSECSENIIRVFFSVNLQSLACTTFGRVVSTQCHTLIFFNIVVGQVKYCTDKLSGFFLVLGTSNKFQTLISISVINNILEIGIVVWLHKIAQFHEANSKSHKIT